MSTYVIGDVQGCYTELQQLLELIDYNPNRDRLGFVGDLVNRGPDSLSVMRFIMQLKNPLIVLGNHDIYLLILGYNLIPLDAYTNTLQDILDAPDRMQILEWLRYQPLMQFEPTNKAVLAHAGIPPQWSIAESLQYAKEVEVELQGSNFKYYLEKLFGNEPANWQNNLIGLQRWRYITNAFTRMRFCTHDGGLDFMAQRESDISDTNYKPRYEWRDSDEKTDILFGHWAYLNGQCSQPNCYALDTGCAWGHTLTALRLEDKKRFSIPAQHFT